MLTLRYARQSSAFVLSPSTFNAAARFLFSSYSGIQQHALSISDFKNSSGSQSQIHRSDIVNYFREWFMSRKIPLYDRIFEILRTEDDLSVNSALSRLNLQVNQSLILDVLGYDQKDVLSCLKFFDWAGRQPGFFHSRVTFNAMFRILSKAKLMSVLSDFLQTYMRQGYIHKVRYFNILVIGYAVAGKCETALILFGRMRYMGVDLDLLSYHVLLDSLVENGYFDAVETVADEIWNRGFQNVCTHSIMIKSLCKRKQLEKAEEYLRNLAHNDSEQLSGIALGTFVDALCKHNQFGRAVMLIDEFQRKGLVSMDHVYGVWMRDLVIAGKLDSALEFLKDKQAVEGYVPDVFRYNMLICKLLKEHRVEEVFELLVDMKERDIVPDEVTMNLILCLLCKAGRMDIALDLYDCRAEFGLSINFMAYNYLINTIVGGVSVDAAYHVLRNAIEKGYVLGEKTFSIIADALCREGRLDEMKELLLFAIDQKIMPSDLVYDKLITALCRAMTVEEGYMILDMLHQLNGPSRISTYQRLIRGCIGSSKEDIAVRLLIEMHEKGYRASRKLIREVVASLVQTHNREPEFFRLLDALLAQNPFSASTIYKFFIGGAGHAQKPELARQVYEMMKRSDVQPRISHDTLLLHSYLKSGKIVHAIHLFQDFSTRWHKNKFWSSMVVGLCRAGKPEHASQIMDVMKAKQMKPKLQCYEELIKLRCSLHQYNKAIELLNDMTLMGRPVSSFIGNVFLLHSLKSRNLYNAWAYLSHKENLTPMCWLLGHLIGVFSGAVQGVHDIGELEQMIQQCFHVDMFTNNILLRRLSMEGIDYACAYVKELSEKGWKPNRFTFDIITHGLAKNGRLEEAREWMDEMHRRGFDLTESTMKLISC